MFKRVVVGESDTIHSDQLTDKHIIVAKRKEGGEDGEGGLIIKERDGYILRLCDSSGSTGHHSTIQKCVAEDTKYGYEFYVL